MSELGQAMIQGIRELGELNPEKKYVRPAGKVACACRYVYEGQPSCIVGRVAWSLGIINADLESEDVNTGAVEELLTDYLHTTVEPDELHWLEYAQGAQDSLMPWGKVPDYADKAMEERHSWDDDYEDLLGN
jgi:hypothetical protein